MQDPVRGEVVAYGVCPQSVDLAWGGVDNRFHCPKPLVNLFSIAQGGRQG